MAAVIQLLTATLTIVVLADILVGYVLPPFHPLRRALDSVVDPLLAPIRRLVPPVGMFDFSPFFLLLLVQILGSVLIRGLPG